MKWGSEVKGKYVLLGANPQVVTKVTKRLNQRLNLNCYDADQMIKQTNSKEESLNLLEDIMKEESWIIQTTYNRVLSVGTAPFETLIFLDFSLLRLVMSCFLRLNFKGIKQVFYYYRVKRPWMVNKINQFGTEKKVVILKNKRQVRKYIKQLG